MKISNSDTGIQFLKFCFAGIFNTAINYLLFITLYKYLLFHYLLSGVIGFLSGAISGYVINRNWTFNAKHIDYKKGFYTYLVVQLISLLFHTSTLFISTKYFNVIPELSQVFGIAASTIVNFTLSKKFVFKSAKRHIDESSYFAK
ncbi:MAG: GtrA family protein [Gammaproteobacteria bacterium]|nr:GtrA family protein [Gammaproteobacteria bacterium]